MSTKISTNGSYSKTKRFLENCSRMAEALDLDYYGLMGVRALMSATPYDTGTTANSWYYIVEKKKGQLSLSFLNANVQNGVPIAIILQYGHGTNNGGWVEGRDYINPAVKPVFDEILKRLEKEVKIR